MNCVRECIINVSLYHIPCIYFASKIRWTFLLIELNIRIYIFLLILHFYFSDIVIIIIFFLEVSGGMVDSITSQRRGSTQSDTSALVSSLTRDPSQSPSGISTTANTRDLSPSPSCSSLHMRSEGSIASPPDTPKKDCCCVSLIYI